MRHRARHLVAPLVAAALLSAATVSVSRRSAAHPVTEDRNGDGRPDVWRTYDREGRLSEVAIDTNFDGRSDVHEYDEAGTLVSRESDRNFDDRVDLVQQFDYTTHAQVRTVEDVDYDGRADLLVLFQNGRPVYSEWARSSSSTSVVAFSVLNPAFARRAADDPLTPFEDPFEHDLAVRTVRVVAGVCDFVGFSPSGWLPATGLDVAAQLASPSAVRTADHRHFSSAILASRSPRGPPLARA